MDGFQSIAGVGQGPGHDHAHSVVEIGLPHLGVDIHLLDIAIIVVGLDGLFSHNFLFKGVFGIKKTRRTRFCDSAS